jgi:hypothetical protein
VSFGPSLLLVVAVIATSARTIQRALSRSPARGPLDALATLGALLPWVYLLLGRRWVLNWGARPSEVERVLPGDDIVSPPAWISTRAITIEAPVEAVWPWLAQMGQDKGGLYSYTWLENLAGLDFHNADRLHPEWQEVAPGDPVRFAPGQDTLMVASAEPNRALVWRILDPATHRPMDPGSTTSGVVADATWAFVLESEGADQTRLIQRFRFGGRPRSLLAVAYTLFIEIPHFVMEERMLRGIRDRAERAWRER